MSHTIRGYDKYGAGHYGASRGQRVHNGVDLVVPAGSDFRSLNSGTVSKLGYAYKGDMGLRYVQVTARDGKLWRYFYIHPAVKIGDVVKEGDLLGTVANLQPRYPGITDHVHFEIMDNGRHLDPTDMIEAD
jgi:murein DD-endopeptidase MepM/ murein hydrolase activator NlpD